MNRIKKIHVPIMFSTVVFVVHVYGSTYNMAIHFQEAHEEHEPPKLCEVELKAQVDLEDVRVCCCSILLRFYSGCSNFSILCILSTYYYI